MLGEGPCIDAYHLGQPIVERPLRIDESAIHHHLVNRINSECTFLTSGQSS